MVLSRAPFGFFTGNWQLATLIRFVQGSGCKSQLSGQEDELSSR